MKGHGHKLGGLVLVLVIAAAVLAGCGGDEERPDNSHINHESGQANGLIPDNREGTPPAPPKETDLRKATNRGLCRLSTSLDVKGDERHLPPDAPPPVYKTEPPISGPHVAPPHQQADGAYRSQPRAIDVVGALDHGRMAIQYAPDLSEEIQLELKGLYDTMYGGTLLFPNEDMFYAVAATTWENTLVCPGWSPKVIDAIRAFGKENWGKHGSEPVENFPVEGPTPANPQE